MVLHSIPGSEACCSIRYVYRGWEKAAESAGQRWNKQECRVKPGEQTGPQGNCSDLVLLSLTQRVTPVCPEGRYREIPALC